MDTLITTQQQKRAKTELVLMNIYNLPSVPKIMVDALKLLDSKTTNTSEIIKVISKDQGLITKILTIANSPLYGLQRKVTSIDFAILILGFGELRNLISILSMMESFKNKTDKYLDQKTFWVHSFIVGSSTKKLAEDLGFHNSGEAFVAGFLHDLGISVLHRFLHSNFVTIKELVSEKNMSYHDAELEVLGMTHEEVGFSLLERWNFPEVLSDVILHHHKPEESKDNNFLAALIHLADYMTQKLEIGKFAWDDDITLSDESKQILRFRNDEETENFILGYKTLFTNQIESSRFLS